MPLPDYLDNASTTPVDKRVIEAMLPYFDEIFGNASSNHIYGKQAKAAVEKARKQVASIINAEADEIIFTSGATEAINLAIKGYWESNREKGNHIVTVKTEHKAVLETCKYLETLGVEVTYLGVDENGLISIEELRNAIRKDTILISVMYVNNEIGVIQDIPKIGEIARGNNVAFFCDATQAVGKISVDVLKDNIDMLCMSAHKFNGPKGVGALYLKSGISITPQIHGGGQEGGLRSGTYNTPLIVGLGVACELSVLEQASNYKRLKERQSQIEVEYHNNNLGTINCKYVRRAPHIVSVYLKNTLAEDYMISMSNKISISKGSACNYSVIEKSHVIKAIGQEEEKTIRISLLPQS